MSDIQLFEYLFLRCRSDDKLEDPLPFLLKPPCLSALSSPYFLLNIPKKSHFFQPHEKKISDFCN